MRKWEWIPLMQKEKMKEMITRKQYFNILLKEDNKKE